MPAINKDVVASVREILSTKINKVEEDLWPKRISRCMQNLYTDLWKSTDFEIGLNIDKFLNRNMKINWHRILNENLKQIPDNFYAIFCSKQSGLMKLFYYWKNTTK
jgi:hypothetical protein